MKRIRTSRLGFLLGVLIPSLTITRLVFAADATLPQATAVYGAIAIDPTSLDRARKGLFQEKRREYRAHAHSD